VKLLYVWIESFRSIYQQGLSLIDGFDVDINDISEPLNQNTSSHNKQFPFKRVCLPSNPPNFTLFCSIMKW